MDWKLWRKRFWLSFRLTILMVVLVLLFDKSGDDPNATSTRILAATRGHAFNYIEWEVNALLVKSKQELFGFQAYIPEDQRKKLLLEYFALQNRRFILQGQLEATVINGEDTTELAAEYDAIQADMSQRQALVEHIIEGQVSTVLRDEGFAVLGQVLPPVTMHFLDIPDVLVVSPREEIRQEMTVTLNPQAFNERVTLEESVASAVPDKSVWITPVGGVGVYPSMVQETDRPVVGFEITAHEWTHHYLIFFPMGYEYFSNPETRIINETTATLVGNEVGNKVIERFYADELAAGQVYLQETPDYRALLAVVEGTSNIPVYEANTWNPSILQMNAQQINQQSRLEADYLLNAGYSAAAQVVLNARSGSRLGFYPPVLPTVPDQRGWIHHTRVSADYLLSLGMVDAAESAMETGRKESGQRVLNQAWFAFYAGYQDNPVVQQQPDGTTTIATEGGGGDPIGAAIYEIRARAGSLKAFVDIMRSITTRDALLAKLAEMRGEG